MTVEERTAIVQRKVEQIERQQLLRENRCKEAESKNELRRKIIIGEMFIKHFPRLSKNPCYAAAQQRFFFKAAILIATKNCR